MSDSFKFVGKFYNMTSRPIMFYRMACW